MSGIGALVWFDGRKSVDPAQVDQFSQGLRPYGRDRQEVCTGLNGALVYAHCARTTIHDPQAAPVNFAGGKFHLVFDGRLDQRAELIAKLGAPTGAGEWSDARLAALSWEKWQSDAPRHWAGEFAVIVWAPEEQRLYCIRDQLGQRPLNWHRGADGLLTVASAAKPMFAVKGVERAVDEQKIADQLLQLFHDSERSYFRGIQRIGFATIAVFSAQGLQAQQYWTLDDVQMQSGSLNADEVAEQGRALLRDATKQTLRGASAPAAFMSGGLDSSTVAVTALDVLPQTQDLPTFTWVPSKDWDGRAPDGTYGDERPYVEAIAAMHPRLKPQFLASEGLGLFHMLEEFVDLAGVAPRNASNFCWLHDIRQTAVDQGHDLLLEGSMGNATLSWNGNGAWLEWLGQGKVLRVASELWRLLPRYRAVLWVLYNLVALPVLPGPAARWVRRAKQGFPSWPHWYNFSAINPKFFDELDMQARLERYDWDFFSTGTVGRAARKHLITEGMISERGEVSLAFRALHGIEARDPFCNLKLVEWCFSLPDSCFYSSGERGLIRHMMGSRLPESVLANTKSGRQVVDWHARMSWDMDRLREELDACADDDELSRYLDVERLRSLLDDWPDEAPLGRMRADMTAAFAPVAMASAFAAGRLVRRTKGSNR